jgi:hypothetical protein
LESKNETGFSAISHQLFSPALSISHWCQLKEELPLESAREIW